MTYIRRLYLNVRNTIRLNIIMLSVLLMGCTILPEVPALQTYLLPVQAPQTAINGQRVDWSLRVNTPNTSQFLSTSRIAVQPKGEEIQVYQGARWSDPLPTLLRNRLIQQFRADGRIIGVSSDIDSLSAKFELGGDLLAYQGVYNTIGEPEVLIRLDVRLIQTSSRNIIASHRFEIQQPITSSKMSEIVQSFGLASDRLSEQVLAWTLEQANRAQSALPGSN